MFNNIFNKKDNVKEAIFHMAFKDMDAYIELLSISDSCSM